MQQCCLHSNTVSLRSLLQNNSTVLYAYLYTATVLAIRLKKGSIYKPDGMRQHNT